MVYTQILAIYCHDFMQFVIYRIVIAIIMIGDTKFAISHITNCMIANVHSIVFEYVIWFVMWFHSRLPATHTIVIAKS